MVQSAICLNGRYRRGITTLRETNDRNYRSMGAFVNTNCAKDNGSLAMTANKNPVVPTTNDRG